MTDTELNIMAALAMTGYRIQYARAHRNAERVVVSRAGS
jgi:hypothetical protein